MSIILGLLLTTCDHQDPHGPESASHVSESTPEPQVVLPTLDPSFVVWESNRSGRWRLWISNLDDRSPRQLTSEPGRRIHCCPHISPDGRWIAYMNLPANQDKYPQGGAVGPMALIRPDGSDNHQIIRSARNYWENRAAVWRNPNELIFINPDAKSCLLDLETGSVSKLTDTSTGDLPWLINAPLTWATSGNSSFSPFDRMKRRIEQRAPLGGCQNYFTGDGQMGYWVAAPGGPFKWLQLDTGEIGTFLKKSDPRLPDVHGYLYFPMISHDRRLLAWGASNNEHSHLDSDYEIYVADIDPESLEILGNVQRITNHPATDRFPDVFQPPLSLGHHRGEAPYRWQPEAPDLEQSHEWSYGDGGRSIGRRADHLYEHPGTFSIEARSGDSRLEGQIQITPPAPPIPVSVELLRNGREIAVQFDEPIQIEGISAKLESGIGITEQFLDRDSSRLRLMLARRIRREDRLELTGVSDRAQSPNTLEAAILDLKPPRWPFDRNGLMFVWQTGDTGNLLFDPTLAGDTSVILTPEGAARLDHDFVLVPHGGAFVSDQATNHRVVNGLQQTYELTAEATIDVPSTRPTTGVLLAESGRGWTNFAVALRGTTVVAEIRTGSKKREGLASIEVLEVPVGARSHVVVTYQPGRLQGFLNGEKVFETESVLGGFFHWRTRQLIIGNSWNRKQSWQGKIEGMAIYNRVLDPEEVQENYWRYKAIVEARPVVESWNIAGTLDQCSEIPTLEEITPYREALVVCRYRVAEPTPVFAQGEIVRVAQWAILDGSVVEIRSSSEPFELTLSRYGENPQLETVVLSDTLESQQNRTLFYSSLP